MNETECQKLISHVGWTDVRNLVSLCVLAFINVLVIVGNCLVIAAVFWSHKLRSVTNFFIVSLAVADLLVGIAVLPFSATWEVFKVWIFGDVWCRIWLAVDVWMCTASILNLCAISLDRYVAVTRPVTYPSIMSTTKAKSLIAGIWVLSFVICFPPLVGWKDQTPPEAPPANNTYVVGNQTFVAVTTTTTTLEPLSTTPMPPPFTCPWTCELTNDAGYVVYSALGSFYIPMFVMLFFYWRIYRAAVRTTRAINQGFKTTKGLAALGAQLQGSNMILRIHRGRQSTTVSSAHSTNGSTYLNNNNSGGGDAAGVMSASKKARLKSSSSYTSAENGGGGDTAILSHSHSLCDTREFAAVSGGSRLDRADGGGGRTTNGAREGTATKDFGDKSMRHGSLSNIDTDEVSPDGAAGRGGGSEKQLSGTCRGDNSSLCKTKSAKSSKRNAKLQAKRFRMETKAAKTLAIIVGGFIVCWLPFFTVYLLRPFCTDCTPPIVFSVLFWLGYCNSAINPLIYALFSKDFRNAFQQIIIRVCCSSYFAANRSYFSPHKARNGKRPPFPFPHPFMSGAAAAAAAAGGGVGTVGAATAATASSCHLPAVNGERFR